MVKILDLKLKLQITKKGGTSCSQYVQQMQELADRLRSICSEVSNQDLVLYTLQGLGFDFESFVTALTMRFESSLMTELSSLLLAHEARMLTNLISLFSSTVNSDDSNS
jgi:gag-polypeptide of LTR copia-type